MFYCFNFCLPILNYIVVINFNAYFSSIITYNWQHAYVIYKIWLFIVGIKIINIVIRFSFDFSSCSEEEISCVFDDN